MEEFPRYFESTNGEAANSSGTEKVSVKYLSNFLKDDYGTTSPWGDNDDGEGRDRKKESYYSPRGWVDGGIPAEKSTDIGLARRF